MISINRFASEIYTSQPLNRQHLSCCHGEISLISLQASYFRIRDWHLYYFFVMKYDIYITLNIDDSVGWVAGGHVNAFVTLTKTKQ